MEFIKTTKNPPANFFLKNTASFSTAYINPPNHIKFHHKGPIRYLRGSDSCRFNNLLFIRCADIIDVNSGSCPCYNEFASFLFSGCGNEDNACLLDNFVRENTGEICTQQHDVIPYFETSRASGDHPPPLEMRLLVLSTLVLW